MKFKDRLIPLAPLLCVVIGSGCVIDHEIPMSEVECSLDFSSHPRNNTYQAVVDKYVDEGLPGLVVLVNTPDDGLWIGAAGFADIENQIPMNPRHLHHGASVAKTYTSVVVFQLAEEGKIDLDEPISTYLPPSVTDSVTNGSRITVGELLNHTSGIPDVFGIEFIMDAFNDPFKERDTYDLLSYVYGQPAAFEPGTGYVYSDANYILLSLIIDRLEGDHKVEFNERIFVPLSLNNTLYHNGDYPEPQGLVNSYWDRYSDGNIENYSDFQIYLTELIPGSDGVIADAQDFASFIQAVGKSRIVSDSSLALMTDWVPFLDSDSLYGYGMGLASVKSEYGTWIGHSGSHIGSAAMVYYLPEEDITVVTLTNTGSFFSYTIQKLFYYDLWNEIEKAVFED
ncbi:beta-lactamase family protein [candidate division WOR-3 bacterium]|nr:beta-lactamase family protein [candidate division WOR-3 bacterium]